MIWWYVEYDCGKSDRFRVLFQLPVQVVLSLTFHKIPLLSSLLLHAIVRVGFLRGYTTASQSTTSITRNCLSAWVWKMGRVAAGCVGYALLGVAE